MLKAATSQIFPFSGDVLRGLELVEAAERLAASDAELIAANQQRIASAQRRHAQIWCQRRSKFDRGCWRQAPLGAGGALFESMETLVEELKAA